MTEETKETTTVVPNELGVYGEHLEKLKDAFTQFVSESVKGHKTKAAALRARQLSMKLRSDLKTFRELSVQRDKREI